MLSRLAQHLIDCKIVTERHGRLAVCVGLYSLLGSPPSVRWPA